MDSECVSCHEGTIIVICLLLFGGHALNTVPPLIADPCGNICHGSRFCDPELKRCRSVCGSMICNVQYVCESETQTCVPSCDGNCGSGEECDTVTGTCIVTPGGSMDQSQSPDFMFVLWAGLFLVGITVCVCLTKRGRPWFGQYKNWQWCPASVRGQKPSPDISQMTTTEHCLQATDNHTVHITPRLQVATERRAERLCSATSAVGGDGDVDGDHPVSTREEELVQGSSVKFPNRDQAGADPDDPDSRDPQRDCAAHSDPVYVYAAPQEEDSLSHRPEGSMDAASLSGRISPADDVFMARSSDSGHGSVVSEQSSPNPSATSSSSVPHMSSWSSFELGLSPDGSEDGEETEMKQFLS